MGGMSDAIQALKLGAWDYVTKPIEDMAVLEHAIAHALERARLLRENREHREHLEVVNEQLRQTVRRLQERRGGGAAYPVSVTAGKQQAVSPVPV